MLKIKWFIYAFLLNYAVVAQTIQENEFFLSVKKIDCNTQVLKSPLGFDCEVTDLKTMINHVTFESPLRTKTNDSIKLTQCVSLIRSDYLPTFEPCNLCETSIEKVFHCDIFDTLMNIKVWVLRTSKAHQLKPLLHNQYLEEQRTFPYALGVYDPLEAPSELIYSDHFIANNGLLTQIQFRLEENANQIIELEDPSRKKELFTFEVPVATLRSQDFEKIKVALKKSIGFEIYEEKRPIKVKFVKFLD